MISETVDQQNQCTDKVQLLASPATRQEKQKEQLVNCIDRMEADKLKKNVLIFGMPEAETTDEEAEKENCVQLIKDFISVKLEIEQTINTEDAYRLGKGKNRPIKVQPSDVKDKVLLFKNAKNLKEKTNDFGKKYFLQSELPERLQEEERWQRQIVACNKRSVVHKLNMSYQKESIAHPEPAVL